MPNYGALITQALNEALGQPCSICGCQHKGLYHPSQDSQGGRTMPDEPNYTVAYAYLRTAIITILREERLAPITVSSASEQLLARLENALARAAYHGHVIDHEFDEVK